MSQLSNIIMGIFSSDVLTCLVRKLYHTLQTSPDRKSTYVMDSIIHSKSLSLDTEAYLVRAHITYREGKTKCERKDLSCLVKQVAAINDGNKCLQSQAFLVMGNSVHFTSLSEWSLPIFWCSTMWVPWHTDKIQCLDNLRTYSRQIRNTYINW
jgi:hypothetical protein